MSDDNPAVDYTSMENTAEEVKLEKNSSVMSTDDAQVSLLKEYIEKKGHKYNIILE